MPLQATSGAASYDGFGGGVPFTPTYIEDIFSTTLYTGNGSTQTINNGIDLSTKGGLVWIKQRNTTIEHFLYDTNRGATKSLSSNDTTPEYTNAATLTAFGSTGFTLGSSNFVNGSTSGPRTYASWTFRKQAKFFDVVTYTGTSSVQNIAHNLGSVPGCIIVKSITNSVNWNVYHRSVGNGSRLILNDTTGAVSAATTWNNTDPTSTQFTVGTSSQINFAGSTYVAYLFAHDAGGFGLTGTDNVISCGSFTAGTEVNLGWEPQWLLVKRSDGTGFWELIDNMRGFFAPPSTTTKYLLANTSDAEASWGGEYYPTATGFKAGYASGTYIYIAIRRGPMKTPTSGTSVFTTNTYTGTGAARTITTGFVTDLVLGHGRTNDLSGTAVADRLRGDTRYLETTATSAEATSDGASQDITGFDLQTGYTLGVPNNSWMNNNGSPGVNWAFRRAPGFFDVVCFTAGTSTNRRVDHNLTTPPQLILLKARNVTQSWYAYSEALGINGILYPNQNWAQGTVTNAWGSSAPTATNFGINEPTFASAGDTYVAYLFASCPGVSKVGSYTGSGTTKQIDCGFTGGARFVLIKRTDDTGDWYVWDSARGIVSGNDPYLLLNSTAAEVTNTDYIDTYSAGFEISSTAPAAINANGGSFIFLAIA